MDIFSGIADLFCLRNYTKIGYSFYSADKINAAESCNDIDLEDMIRIWFWCIFEIRWVDYARVEN